MGDTPRCNKEAGDELEDDGFECNVGSVMVLTLDEIRSPPVSERAQIDLKDGAIRSLVHSKHFFFFCDINRHLDI